MRRVLVRQALLRPRQAHFQKSGPQRALAGDEGGAAGGAGLLAVIVGEYRALIGDAVDVGRAIAHHAAIVGADVPVADVVGHDDEDVGLLLLLRRRGSLAVAIAINDTSPRPKLQLDGVLRRILQ